MANRNKSKKKKNRNHPPSPVAKTIPPPRKPFQLPSWPTVVSFVGTAIGVAHPITGVFVAGGAVLVEWWQKNR